MKTIVSGVALAAILALAMPAWAQNAGAEQPNAPANGPETSATMTHVKTAHATRGMHARRTPHRNTGHVAMRRRAGHPYAAQTRPMPRTTTARTGGTSPTDNMANQLNREENQRLSGSSMPPMTGPNMAPPAGNPNMAPPAGNPNMAPPTGNPNMAPMGAPNQPIQGP